MTSQKDPEQQPAYGRRLLPCVLDDEAQANPEKVFAAIARSNDLSQGFQDITFRQAANAVNYLAHKLRATFGSNPDYEYETVTYIGPSDLRYSLIFYAAVKSGFKVFLPSPRNARATNVLLMEQTKSSKIIYAKEMEVVANGLCTSKGKVKSAAIEPLSELLEVEAPLFPYHPSFAEAVRQPVVVLHSSGSTGLPKPVVMTHGTFAVMDNDRNFPRVAGRKNHDFTIWDFDGTPGRIYEPFPSFHLGGFYSKVVAPLYTNAIPVFGPPTRPPSRALALDIMKQQRIRGCILAPSMAEQLLQEPEGMDFFKQLDIFCYAGGPLSERAGNAISEVTMVCQFYGSTEVGQIRQLVPRREDWSYMEFHPSAKIEMRPSDDDAFELVVLADATTEDSVALNHNYRGTKEWQTKDLFKPHPTKKDLWRFHGRKDDIIVLSNGEKLNPVPMEKELQGIPNISGALVTGQNHFQPALIIEMKASSGDGTSMLLDSIWPAIESANNNMPGHGRIIRSMIMLAKADKPFVRAAKGTVIRKMTEAIYAKEIEDLYASQDRRPSTKPSPLVATAFSHDAVDKLIRSILPPSIHPEDLNDYDDLYVSGLDSLTTMEAVESLRSSLAPHRSHSQISWLSTETFYANPSIGQLSRLVLAFLNQGVIPKRQNRQARMLSMLETFSAFLKRPPQPPPSERRLKGLSLIITGTTGTLGTYLLERYCCDPAFSRIYCLNRSAMAEEQWNNICERRNIVRASNTPKLSFIMINSGLRNLGLDYASSLDIAHDCDLILHTAWKVDFNQNLSSFAENIQSVMTLVNWSALSPHQPRIVFLSSISSVGPWNPTYDDDIGIPEGPIEDLEAALSLGYSESKQIAERLLDRAASESQVPVSILRIGQIAGPSTAVEAKWTERELFPSILKTSKCIGKLPIDLPAVEWIPVDVVASIVIELVSKDMGDLSLIPRYYHVVNPNPVPWCEFVPIVERYCGPDVHSVPLSQWVETLHTFDATDPKELLSKPALKMLGFFSLMASRGSTTRYQTSVSTQASMTMAGLEPVSQSLMETWLKQSV